MTDIDSEIAGIEADMALGDSSEYWHDTAKQERYGQLLGARDSGTPAPAINPNRQRIAEIEKDMAGPGNSSKYWHSIDMQAEYRRRLEAPAEARRLSGEPALSEALGITADQAADMQQRVDSAFDGIDTSDLDSAFEGMSGDAQGYAMRMLADPSKREAYIYSMPEAALEELMAFVEGMPDHEVAALERALLLS